MLASIKTTEFILYYKIEENFLHLILNMLQFKEIKSDL
jgi:hypothetical protein